MIAPTLADADKAIAYAQQQKARGASAADPAVQSDCYRQAAVAFGNASRIMAALADAIAPAEPRPGPLMNFGAPGRPPAAFTPGPR